MIKIGCKHLLKRVNASEPANIQYLPVLPNEMAVLRTIVIGSQRKAEIFQHLLAGFNEFEFCGFYDPDDIANANVLGELIYSLELCEKADVFIFDRHLKHVDLSLVENLMKMGKHILFDGFHIHDASFVSRITQIQKEAGTCFHIANVLHNKPLYTTASQFIRKPRFIKIEKNCIAPRPGEFENWLFSNLSQELDIAFRMAESGIRRITARPLFLFGNSPDLLNVHIEFDNDSICHISAGRAVESGLHKFRIFQQDRLFHLDFNDHILLELRPLNPVDQLSILNDDYSHAVQEFIEINRPVMPFDMWKMEFRNFHENIVKNLSPVTGLEHLESVSHAASEIVNKIQRKYAEV